MFNASSSAELSTRPQAWIDVGGTFTDCYVRRPNEPRLLRIKQLSSGLVPISISPANRGSGNCCSASELSCDTDRFWVGAELRCLRSDGVIVGQTRVVEFRSEDHSIETAEPLTSIVSDPFDRLLRWELDPHIEAPVLAVRRLLQVALADPLPPIEVRMGTTRGTNALLTRRGTPTVLAITSPFEDLAVIGDQTRPQLFDLAVRREPLPAERVIGITARLDARGQVITPIDVADTRNRLREAFDSGYRSIAICLMHSYLNSAHEECVESLARSIGFEHVSRSSRLAPLIDITARTRTTVVDAYLGPIVREYLQRLADQFGGDDRVDLSVMTSAGGLVHWREYAGKDSILSGPAGGVVALQATAAASSNPRLIGLDMGGTSTDVCRTGPEQTLQYESTKAGIRILTPTLPIETVASGGGSICWFDGVSLRVGPQSAGALPGPACYGRGGPLTVTDLNVLLGRLPASQFPFELDTQAAEKRLGELRAEAARSGVLFRDADSLAEGLRTIANQQMAEAVRTVSIAEGADPRDHTLVGFGGAAGQHICQIADLLGIEKILDSADAGLLSARGMGLAVQRRDRTVPVYQSLMNIDWFALLDSAQQAQADARGSLHSGAVETRSVLELRYVGTDSALPIEWPTDHQIIVDAPHDRQRNVDHFTDAFQTEHRRRFGYARPSRAIEVTSLRVEVTERSDEQLPDATRMPTDRVVAIDVAACARGNMRLDGRVVDVPHVPRELLIAGQRLEGPAVVLNDGSTLVVDSGWKAESLSDCTLWLCRNNQCPSERESDRPSSAVDVVTQTVFAQRISGIATQMGLVLQQTAVSVNVKQRRDYSCAVFDGSGRMLAGAPHVPVHLGAMGLTVRSAMKAFPDLQPGDVVVTNDPYRGGSHLPDVTVISPVFFSGSTRPAMFTANRAHHADIGGIVPGSMSVSASKLGEEGAIIAPLKMSREECDELLPLRDHLKACPYPPRNIEENLADMRAQIAANARGAELLQDVAAAFSPGKTAALSESVLETARRRVELFIENNIREPMAFSDHLDDGTAIRVRIAPIDGNRMRVDFTGTGGVSATNFNANPSIVTAAVIYVLRTLIADDLPLNEGILRAVELIVPPGVLNPTPAENPYDSPAVAAGNVETSQRVVDCLLGAFGAAAASQGTMNNLLFGNQRFGFYETICGGSGAVHGHDGTSGVHTHMTNTRLTDPEILESRYPVQLELFQLRRGSGGLGRWRGGDGVIRRIRFLEPVSVSLLTSRRGSYAPYGASGGQPGQVGSNWLIRQNGTRSPLPGCCQVELQAGDAIELQTPGGGGYGNVAE
ncbi:MAG: hydantoinase B/oxoprolinase family protein [Pirellulales bacterium]